MNKHPAGNNRLGRKNLAWNRLFLPTFLILFIVGMNACGHKGNNSPGEKDETNSGSLISRDITRRALEYADSMLTLLTLEERVGQCLMPSIPSISDSANISLLKRFIKDFHVGGIVLLKGNLKSAEILSRVGRESLVPLFIAIDAEWGLGMRLDDAPVYPKNGHLSPQLEEPALYDYGRHIAEECRSVGINMVLGPVIDVLSAKGSVIGNRAFGSDPSKVAQFGIAYAKGLESGGVISVAKHFPGHGSLIQDSHKGVAELNKQITELDTTDLKPFKEFISSGLSGIMAGHISAKALDPSGIPASISEDILTRLLREEMGFKGLILTDAFDMGGAATLEETDALEAGADIILCPQDIEKAFYIILEKASNNHAFSEILNNRCKQILFYKSLFLQPNQ